MSDTTLTDLAIALFEARALKFGQFKLKSGIMSPFYVDLRVTVSYPKIMKAVAAAMLRKLNQDGVTVDQSKLICGVPYTALPFATCMSIDLDVPMLVKRKEAKEYGTANLVEGHYKEGQNAIIVEDVVTSGISVFETIAPLEKMGLEVTDIMVLLDREQGGRRHIESKGKYRLHAVFTISEVTDILLKAGKIDAKTAQDIRDFVQQHQVADLSTQANTSVTKDTIKKDIQSFTYAQRANYSQNEVAKKLFNIMDKKKTNLSVAADVTKSAELINIAKNLGPHICMLKTHIDVIDDFSESLITELKQLADEHDFLLFEDRKFADIGSTVQHQFLEGVYHIGRWADAVTSHSLPGPGILQGLSLEPESQHKCGVLLLAHMSSQGNLATGDYTRATCDMARKAPAQVMGLIAQNADCIYDGAQSLEQVAGLAICTPGVQLQTGGDGMGQQYNTPERVVVECGADVIIVGRGIYKASDDMAAEALKYQQAGWNAYLKRVDQSKN